MSLVICMVRFSKLTITLVNQEIGHLIWDKDFCGIKRTYIDAAYSSHLYVILCSTFYISTDCKEHVEVQIYFKIELRRSHKILQFIAPSTTIT
jgi:hypothetical protein